MPTRFCTRCWREQPALASVCAYCGAPLAGPEGNGVPYTEKLLRALQEADGATRARAALVLGRIGELDDHRITRALVQALGGNAAAAPLGMPSVQVAAALALAQLDACEASDALSELAVRDDAPLASGVSAVESLGELAHQGCGQAEWQLERIAREAGSDAMRMAASVELARLNEPR